MELEHLPSRRLSNVNISPPPLTPRVHKKNPKPPHPDADTIEVQEFFKEVFLANRVNLDDTQAATLALKLQVNGDSLYRLDKETFVKAFEAEGVIIYDLVLHGKWGYVY